MMNQTKLSSEVLFIENKVSAQSLKNAWTRLASANGCIKVVLTLRTLAIKPPGLAKWLIRLLGLDLCHEIPISNIRGVEERGKWRSYGKVEVHFMTVKGEDKKIVLYMKKYSEFIEKVNSAIH